MRPSPPPGFAGGGAPLPPPLGLGGSVAAAHSRAQSATMAALRERCALVESERDAALGQLRSGADHPLCRASVKGLDMGGVLAAALSAHEAKLKVAQQLVLERQRVVLGAERARALDAVTRRANAKVDAVLRDARNLAAAEHRKRTEVQVRHFITKAYGDAQRHHFNAWHDVVLDQTQERHVATAREEAIAARVSEAEATLRAAWRAEATSERELYVARAARELEDCQAQANLALQRALVARDEEEHTRQLQLLRVAAAALTKGRWTDDAAFKVLLKVTSGKPEADQIALIAHALGMGTGQQQPPPPPLTSVAAPYLREGSRHPSLEAIAQRSPRQMSAHLAQHGSPRGSPQRAAHDADRFTVALDPRQSLGMKLSRHRGRLQIASVTPGGQAESAGVAAGDGICECAGADVQSLTTKEALALLKNVIATARKEGAGYVKLAFVRESAPPAAAPPAAAAAPHTRQAASAAKGTAAPEVEAGESDEDAANFPPPPPQPAAAVRKRRSSLAILHSVITRGGGGGGKAAAP